MAVRVLHLTGSPTSDFFCDLSRVYARGCLDVAADAGRYENHVAHVAPDGSWRFPEDLTDAAITAAAPMPVGDAVARLLALAPDVMVPQLFCPAGMTHHRALFDLLGIPYVGNPPDVMALAMDKARTRAVVAAAGVAVPEGEVLRDGAAPTLAPPVVVKPVDADNSAGVGLVRDAAGYGPALAAAREHGDAVLVERYVAAGREVRCGILVRGGRLVCLPLEEYDVDPEHRPIRGYPDKLRPAGGGGLELVAKEAAKAWIVDEADPITARVWAAARRCHVALGCRDYSLFDFRIDPYGRPWFMEAGPYCSFSGQSVVAVMARAAGIPTTELFARAVDDAVARAGVLR